MLSHLRLSIGCTDRCLLVATGPTGTGRRRRAVFDGGIYPILSDHDMHARGNERTSPGSKVKNEKPTDRPLGTQTIYLEGEES